MVARALLAVSGAVAVGCVLVSCAGVESAGESQTPPPVASTPLEREVLSIAAQYKSFKRVSDGANWAPELCRIPAPTGVQGSASKDSATHGRKLYYLYAKDADAYSRMSMHSAATMDSKDDGPWRNPVGQAVVKESFRPIEISADEAAKLSEADVAHVGGAAFKAGEPSGLFIMLKTSEDSPQTDGGWIYAVTSPDASSIRAIGKIESCMECHAGTDRDRLYGHRWSWRGLKIDGKPAEEVLHVGPPPRPATSGLH